MTADEATILIALYEAVREQREADEKILQEAENENSNAK